MVTVLIFQNNDSRHFFSDTRFVFFLLKPILQKNSASNKIAIQT
jgi:hypothetical protein